MKLILPEQILQEMLVHCKEGYPNEVCGILAGRENEVSKIYKMTNIESSPVSFFMDSGEQFKVMKDMREKNLSMLAIYHSHPSSPIYPSGRDVSLAFYEDAVYVIVGLMDREPVVKAFSIKNKKIEEIEITVTP
jgi:proteasome lid subunit RPN8/RPN11